MEGIHFEFSGEGDSISPGMAAITGISVVYGKKATAPAGYAMINRDMNTGAGGEYVFICYTTSPDAGPPITAIQVLAGGSSNFPIPPGYTKVNQDLNKGSRGKYVFLCYTTNNCIPGKVTGLDVIMGDNYHTYPPDSSWIRVNQDCNHGAGGRYIFIAYKSTP